jgi:hypothetical protein
MLARLAPHPHRGDTIAAGAVPLSLFALLVALRMTQWGVGLRFAVVALVVVLILTMGWLAPLEYEGPRSYHSMLLVAGLLPLAVALVLLAEVLGAAHEHPGAGAFAWAFAVESIVAVACARRANSAVCTLIAALAAAVAVEAFVSFVFKPSDPGTFRAFLVALSIAFAAGAARLRDRRRRHAVQLVSASGVMALTMALTLAPGLVVGSLAAGGLLPPRAAAVVAAAAGWKVYVLAVGIALVGYGGVDREPGPAYVGVAVLASFLLLDGLPGVNGATLIAWPLLLLLAGAVLLAVGLRPIRPLPPEPPTRPLPPEPPTEPDPTEPLAPREPPL